MPKDPQAELNRWLQDQGHSPDEVERVLAKVAEYDKRTVHESVFDSIASGGIDLGEIIREALGE